MASSFSLLREAKEGLGLTDEELAMVLGRSRQHVQSVMAEKYAEHLSPKQARALLDYARLIRDRAIDVVARMELLA